MTRTPQLPGRARRGVPRPSYYSTPTADLVRERARAVCAVDDMFMKLCTINAGLNAIGKRTCTSTELALPMAEGDDCFSEALSTHKANLPHSATGPSRALASLWSASVHYRSDARPGVVSEYGPVELGLFATRELQKGSLLQGPMFLLVQVKADQEELDTDMQFEVGPRCYVGCGPARLINHSCRPNVIWERQPVANNSPWYTPRGMLVVLRAIERIKAGTQLYASYGEGYFGAGFARCKCPHHPKRKLSPVVSPPSRPATPPLQARMTIDVIDLSLDDADASDDDVVFLRECRTPSATPLPSPVGPPSATPSPASTKRPPFDMAAYLRDSRERILHLHRPIQGVIDLTADKWMHGRRHLSACSVKFVSSRARRN